MLTEGKHDVLYAASDEDGNQARCGFTVTVYNARHIDLARRRWGGREPHSNTSFHFDSLQI